MTVSARDHSPFEYHGGLHLRDTILWMDAVEARSICFVSHAGVAGAQEHQKIISTAETAELLRSLAATHGRGRKVREPQALVTPFNRVFTLGNLSLELFPSGHCLGSASLLVRHEGQALVYAGQINTRRGTLVQALEARHCDVLVLPVLQARREFVLPPLEQVEDSLVRFVKDGIEEGTPALIFCQPLGEAQEVAHLLLEQGIEVRAHRRIDMACRTYTEAGIDLAEVKQLRGGGGTGGPGPVAVLWPLSLRNSPTLRRFSGARTALVGPEALDPESRRLACCDAAFPLSCVADYNGLIEYVKACQPGMVILHAEPTTDLEQDLRGLGMAVTSLGQATQMTLF